MTAELHHVGVDTIVAEDNIRRDVETTDLKGLAQSIVENGLMSPLTVSAGEDGTYNLESGFRRLAAIKLGIREGMLPADFPVPVLANGVDGDNDKRRVRQIVENIQRHDLDAIEEAEAFRSLIDQGMPQKEIARRVGKSAAHVSKRLSLLTLDGEFQVRITEGRLPVDLAVRLTKVTDEDLVHDLRELKEIRDYDVDRAVNQQKSRDELAKAVQAAGQIVGDDKVFDPDQASELEEFIEANCPEGYVASDVDMVSDVISIPADANAVYIHRAWNGTSNSYGIVFDIIRFQTEEEAQAEEKMEQADLTPYQQADLDRRAAASDRRQAENALKLNQREFLTSLAAEGKRPKVTVVDLALRWLVLTMEDHVGKRVAETLGIEKMEPHSLTDSVILTAAASEAAMLRVVFALMVELGLSSYHPRRPDFLEYLSDVAGYEPEKKLVADVAKAKKAEERTQKALDKIVDELHDAEEKAEQG